MQLPFIVVFAVLMGPKLLWLISGVGFVSAIYNLPRYGFKARPPFDVLNQAGYLFVFVFSSWLNVVPQLPWETFVIGAMFAMHAHLFGEVLDIEPDGAVGRITTAVKLGYVRTKLTIAGMLVVESGFAWIGFGDFIIAIFLVLSAGWFVLDALVLWKNRPYSPRAMRFFLLLWNAFAVVGAIYVLTTGALTETR